MSASIRPLVATLALLLASVAAMPAQDPPVHTAHLELIHGKPVVLVMVNGQGPFRFVLDTGTGAEAFVTPQLAERLHLLLAGHARVGDPGSQEGQRVPVHLLQSLQIAGADVEFNLVTAVEHSLGPFDSSCQGLLGFPLFRDYLLTLDYPNQRLTLARGALAPDGERLVLPFRAPVGVPTIPLRIGSLPVDAQIDSGGGGLSLPAPFASRLKFATHPAVSGRGQSLSARFPFDTAQLATDVHVGVYTFKHPWVEIHAGFPLANFGSVPMQNFALTFDQKSSLVRFDSARRTFSPAAPTGTSQAIFAAGEWQTPGTTLTYPTPD
jgi:hypothetical protein